MSVTYFIILNQTYQNCTGHNNNMQLKTNKTQIHKATVYIFESISYYNLNKLVINLCFSRKTVP